MSFPDNQLKSVIDFDQHVIVVHQSDYKLLGWILVIASMLPISTLFGATPAIQVILGLMGGVPLVIGLNMVFKERRKRWDLQRRVVVREVRWLGRNFKVSSEENIDNFSEVQVLATPVTNRPGIKGSPPGVLVRLRHRKDSPHTYPGTRSWILGGFPNKRYREQAMELAERASVEFKVPLRDDLAK